MTTLQRILIIIGSLSLATAILFAAYDFHVLGDVLTQQQKQAWSLAFQMQSFHALGLFLVAFLTGHLNRSTTAQISGSWYDGRDAAVFRQHLCEGTRRTRSPRSNHTLRRWHVPNQLGIDYGRGLAEQGVKPQFYGCPFAYPIDAESLRLHT